MIERMNIPALVCTDCGIFFTGKYAEKKAKMHSEIPLKTMSSLDGLLVKRSVWPNSKPIPVYTAIIASGQFNPQHEALYTHTDYR
jgi:hypothetical protein